MAEKPMSAEPLDTESTLALAELCEICRVEADLVLDLMDEGILEPVGQTRSGTPAFPAVAVRRVRVFRRLQRDLGVNRAGAGLALELLDEVRRLRARLRVLEQQLLDE